MRYYTPKRVLSYLLSNCFILYALLNRREKWSKKRGDLWLLLHNARSRRISSWDVNLSQNVPKRYKTTFIVKFYFRSLFSNPLRNSYPILLLFAGVFSLRERHGCFVFFFLLQPPKSDYRMRLRMNYQNQSRRLRQITQSRCLIIHDKMRKPNSLIVLL